jgi:hypothetical protein
MQRADHGRNRCCACLSVILDVALFLGSLGLVSG